MKKGTNRFIPFIILILTFSSCGKNVVFTDSVPMKEKTWGVTDIASFEFSVTDTVNSNDLNFIIRTGSSYPFRNIYLFVTTIAPDGERITDTLQYQLADEKGNWYGKGFGDIHELTLPYRQSVYFPSSGIWKMGIQHGMRTEYLKGIYDFSLRIEKNPNQKSGSGKK